MSIGELRWLKPILLRIHGFFYRLPVRLLYGGLPSSRSSPGAKRLLLLRTDRIGDFVEFTPALKHIRNIYGRHQITLVLNDRVSELAAACPYVDEVVPINIRKCRYNFFYWLRTIRKLRSKSFDTAIHCTYSRDPLSDEMVYCCGAPERIAWDGDLVRHDRRLRLRTASYYTRVLVSGPHLTREIDRNRALVQELGGEVSSSGDFLPELWISDREREFARALLESEGLFAGNPLLVTMATGASTPLRMWPAPAYAEVADRLMSEYGARVLLCGSRAEQPLAQGIGRLMRQPPVILNGRTNLRQTAALFELCDVFLGNESGALHLAVAMRMPTLCILGGGHFGRHYPYGPPQRHRAVFKPMDCYHCVWKCIYKTARCIQEISPDHVWRELRSLMEEVVLPARAARDRAPQPGRAGA